MPGSEDGTMIADCLNTIFSMPNSNDTNSSLTRRNKYFMHKRLKESGLPSIRQSLAKTVEEGLSFLKQEGIEFPVVVKPQIGGGSNDVFITNSEKEFKDKFGHIIGKENLFGYETKDVLIQECIKGPQYIMNYMSSDGGHFLCDAYIYDKRIMEDGTIRLDGARLCDSNEDIIKDMDAYCRQIMDSFGVKYGPSHIEIIVTDRGPIMVEYNGRLMGGSFYNEAIKQSLETWPLDLVPLCYTDRQKFAALYSGKSYNRTKNLMMHWVTFDRAGKFGGLAKESEIKAMPSFHCLDRLPEKETYMERTVDCGAFHGVIYFCHESSDVIKCDREQVLQWQYNDELVILE